MKKLLLALAFIPLLSFSQEKKVKNVILLIGDGMGLSQLSTAYYFDNPEKHPNFGRFPVVGLINTSSAKQKITDSAAGATAFATGRKSYNGAISVDTNEVPIPTLLEIIEKFGVKSGLIATSSITHATPACFYSHVVSRSLQDDIAKVLPRSGVDFFAAGGLKFFQNRADGFDYYRELIKKGFVMDTTLLDPEMKVKITTKYGFLLAPNGLPSKLEGRGDFLVDATNLGIKYLSKNENGFFLMVEGSQIDWEGHAANAQGIIEEVRDFDKAVGAALDFAEVDGETLVIVTADHETGGFALSPAIRDSAWVHNEIEPKFYEGARDLSYAAHTATLIPVLAYGPNAATFGGIYQNTDIFHKIIESTGWAATVSIKTENSISNDKLLPVE